MNRLRGLYAITDETLIAHKNFDAAIEAVLEGGASIIQYRNKNQDKKLHTQQASMIRDLCRQHRALFIINDDIELAAAINADGVHLGQNDGSVSYARERLGENAIIGASCYNSLELALRSQDEGADYIAFGSFFVSPTKPGAQRADITLLQQARQQIHIPICAIGGITADNAGPLLEHGADMLAVISALFNTTDVKSSAEKLSALFSS